MLADGATYPVLLTVSQRGQSLLCVVPHNANTDFARNYIEGLYTGVSNALVIKGVKTCAALMSLVRGTL